MAIFDKFKGKGKTPVNRILKINKFESKEAVLDLIAEICTASDDFDVNPYFRDYKSLLISQYKDLEEGDYFDPLSDIIESTFDELSSNYYSLIDLLENNHGKSTITIAVAGGYSSGKSSFLNYLIGDANKNLLPTGVEPVSLVNTNITFSTESKDLRIRGKNFKDSFVELDTTVLDSIQHSSKSKVHVASVLKSLHIDLPTSVDYLNNVSFIDTPGYNNSTAVNVENAKSDRQTAIEAATQADALIWCVDMETGEISKDDCNVIQEILKDRKDLPWIVVLTKRDKKESEQLNILSSVAKTISSRFSSHLPFSIIGFSKNKETPFLQPKNRSLRDFISLVWSNNGNRHLKTYILNRFSNIISSHINVITRILDDLENDRKELANHKKDAFEEKKNVININEKQIEILHEFLFDHYIALVSRLKSYHDIETYDRNYREKIFKDLKETYEYQNDDKSFWFDHYKNRYNEVVGKIEECKKVIDTLYNLQKNGCRILNACFDTFYGAAKKYYSMPPKKRENFSDIFSAIANDNFKSFTACFSDGVDLSVCNPIGYNPLTYIARHGNNEMMKYLIEHDADLSLKDNNGLTAFAVAVVNHHKNICELLLEKDYSLKNTNIPIKEVLSKKNYEMMKYLIEHDADLSLKGNDGLTAFEVAVVNHYKDICELLLEKDPSLKYTNVPIKELLSKNNFENWITNL